jgi:hypothetical protein
MPTTLSAVVDQAATDGLICGRDAQLGEDAHPCANQIGALVFTFLRTVVMNLLRRAGYRSIRQGLREFAYDIQGMLALGGVTTAEARP